MSSDPLRDLDLDFPAQNNQTVNAVDQTLNLTGTSPVQASPIWDDLAADGGGLGSPSTAPTSLSLGSFQQTSARNSLSDPSPATPSRQSSYSQSSRQILPTRAPRQRTGNERKRSRLSTDSTPFDSVDYWIQFDDDALPDVPEDTEPAKSENAASGAAQPAQRSRKAARQGARPLRRSATASEISSRGARAEDFYADDSALDNALSDEEQAFSMNLTDQLSKIDSAPPREVPPREGLYSTPLSWERPQPGLRMDSLIGMNSPMLTEAEQRRLIAIAMNPGPSMGGLGANLSLQYGGLDTTLGAGFGTASLSQISNQGSQARSNARMPPPGAFKRQNSSFDKEKDKPKTGDRAAHNDIERKYRTNLKDKISELRDAVPSLRTIAEIEGDDDDGSQPSRGPKVSKGTVLTKATEYIHYLERRNKQIVLEHNDLSRRLQAFEQLLQASARQNFQMPNYSRTLFDPRGFC